MRRLNLLTPSGESTANGLLLLLFDILYCTQKSNTLFFRLIYFCQGSFTVLLDLLENQRKSVLL